MKKVMVFMLLLAASLSAKDIYATFSVTAKKSANLAFITSGIVKRVNVDVTSVVKKGDILAELHNDDIKAALHVAKVAQKYAKKSYERQQKVKNLIDASKLDAIAFKYENAKAQVAYQQAILDKTILKAPFDGVIFKKSVEEGDALSGAMIHTVFKLQSLHARELHVEVDQKYWKQLKIGQTYRYKVDGDTKEYVGKISKIYPYANAKNRKIIVEVEAKDLVVGLFGDGYITIDESK